MISYCCGRSAERVAAETLAQGSLKFVSIQKCCECLVRVCEWRIRTDKLDHRIGIGGKPGNFGLVCHLAILYDGSGTVYVVKIVRDGRSLRMTKGEGLGRNDSHSGQVFFITTLFHGNYLVEAEFFPWGICAQDRRKIFAV